MKMRLVLTGVCTGFLNGLFGAGGGLLCVPLLQKCELSMQQSHATSLAVTLPLSGFSAALLLFSGIQVTVLDLLLVILCGIPGALLGANLLKHIAPLLLQRIFAVVILISAVRLLLR